MGVLDSHVKAPEAKRHREIGYAHDPYIRVRANRAKFVHAVLTIVQAWIARGGKEMTDPKRIVGGFEQVLSISAASSMVAA